jgi:putative aldouronate transport system permease protein
MVQSRSFGDRAFNVALYSALALLALTCLLPFLHMVAVSLSGKTPILARQVGIVPLDFTLENYQFLLRNRQVLGSAAISVVRVSLSVPLTLLVSSLAAYALSRDHIYMPGRGAFKVVLIFFMLFSGGLIPMLYTIRSLGLYNNFLVLVVPGLFNIGNTILLMNYFRGLPRELEDAAVMDGASHLQVLFQVMIPLSLPVIATLVLFDAIGAWNDWFTGVLYLQRQELWPLQTYLYRLINEQGGVGQEALRDVTDKFRNATPAGLKAALLLSAALPILCIYPLLQRYFVTGLRLGAVKE